MKLSKILFNIVLFLMLNTISAFGLNYVEAMKKTGYYMPYHQILNAPSPMSFGTTMEFIPMSPQAASLGIYGHIPVGNYTGTAQVNIPLYEIDYKELSVPVAINYRTTGFKPEEVAGPVGLGWSLQAGGIISRVINGLPDKGPLHNPITIDNIQLVVDDIRMHSSWSDSTHLKSYLNIAELQVDRTSDPDTYYYNFNGHTGKFYQSHSGGGGIKIQSQQGETFTVALKSTPTGQIGVTETDIIGFVMTDSKGIKYIFGNVDNNDNDAVEYVRVGYNQDAVAWNEEATFVYTGSFKPISTSFLLKYIISPYGYQIEFKYSAEHKVLSMIRFSDYVSSLVASMADFTNHNPICHGNVKCIQHSTRNLEKIVTPVSEVNFSYTTAVDQDYFDYLANASFSTYKGKYVVDDRYIFNLVGKDDGNDIGVLVDGELPKKVDSIQIFDKNNSLVKNISFKYKASQSRLKLERLDIAGSNKENKQTYKFEYNPWNILGYLTGQTDYYGYYNGKSFFDSISISEIQQAAIDYAKYVNLYEKIERLKGPDTTLVKYETLKKVIYPTGGYTTFTYEPNQYGRKYKIWPFNVEENSNGNEITGGIRIKEVCNYDYINNLLNKKKYHYVKDFTTGGRNSSGVLTFTPAYLERYTDKKICYASGAQNYHLNSFFRFNSNPEFSINHNPIHITYSEVTVEEADGSFTVYKYNNYDNGYLDKKPLAYTSDVLSDNQEGTSGIVEFWKNDIGISMELERGLLQSEYIYDASHKLKKSISYTYNDDESRFDNNIRYVSYIPNSFCITTFKSYRIIAGLHYTYFPYIKEIKSIDYLGNGNITHVKKFTYSGRYIKTTSIENSDGTSLSKEIEYVSDKYKKVGYPSIYSSMGAKSLNFPIEQIIKSDNKIISREVHEYAFNLSISDTESSENIYLNKIQKHYGDSTIVDLQMIRKYDSYKNPLEIEDKSGIITTYLWSYSGQYPVAKIRNASYEQVSSALYSALRFTVEEDIAIRNPTFNEWNEFRNHSEMKNAQITTYTYQPLVGMTSMTDHRRVTTYYEYDSANRLSEIYIIENSQKQILETYDYHYQNQ